MSQLTPEGEKIVAAIADRYAIGVEAVKMMLDAVARGGGSMAQFNLPEFGGSGQWMRGGMTMVGDMFNNSMKATVDNLCNDLSRALDNQPNIFAPFTPSQSQMPSQTQMQSQGSGGTSFWQSSQSGSWWPSELGNPSSTGSQNNLRYAYFPGSNRLAIDDRGHVEVYDTSGYDIGGFGQQQSGDASLTFTSQRGTVRVDRLPRVTTAASASPTRPSEPQRSTQAPVEPSQASPSTQPPASGDTGSILGLIEQLGQLKEKGLITEQEFAAKKAELLKRL